MVYYPSREDCLDPLATSFAVKFSKEYTPSHPFPLAASAERFLTDTRSQGIARAQRNPLAHIMFIGELRPSTSCHWESYPACP